MATRVEKIHQFIKKFQAQFSLQRGSSSVDSRIDLQAYTNLLKASWILIDIIQYHPQRTFLDKGSQQLELMAFSNVLPYIVS